MNPLNATIYIPTYRRIDNQMTWSWISDLWRKHTYLVAVHEEAGALDMLGYPVLVGPDGGIGNTRQWILDQHDVERDGEWCIMMDDDLRFYIRREDDPTKFRQFTGEQDTFDLMMDQFMEMLSFGVFGGMANRSGANRDTRSYRLNTRLHDLLAIHVPTARRIGLSLNAVRFMEDFDASLQVLSAGYPTLCLNTFCKGDAGSNSKGGCSVYRDHAGQAAAATALAERWPGLVRLAIKPGWQGSMAEPRTDVVVQWAKAYKQGRENRDLIGAPQEELPEIFTLI